MNTISLRLRGINDDVEEDSIGTAALQEIFTTITSKYGDAVQIVDETSGQLRNTYDILKDLSAVWSKLTANEQQFMAEKIAGKRQVNVLQSLLGNWESVENAVANANNAEGSAAVEQEKYINSLTGAINKFQAALENMYAGAVDSGFLTFFVQTGTEIVKFVDNVGLINIAMGVSVGLISQIFSSAGKFSQLRNIFTQFKTVFDSVNKSMGGFKNTLGAILKTGKGFWKTIFGNAGATNLESSTGNINWEAQKSGLGEEALKNLEEIKNKYKELLVLEKQGLTTRTQRQSMDKLAKQLGEAGVEQAGKELAIETAINTVRQIGLTLLVAAVSWGINKLYSAVKDYIEDSQNAAYNFYTTVKDTNDELDDINDKIKDINDTIADANGYSTQEQQDELKDLQYQLAVTREKAEAAKNSLESAFNASEGVLNQTGYKEHNYILHIKTAAEDTDTSSLETYDYETIDLGSSLSWKNSETGKQETIYLSELKSFFDETGKIIDDKYSELIKYVGEDNAGIIEALLSTDREDLSTGNQVFYDELIKIKQAISDYDKQQEAFAKAQATGGITKDTISAKLKQAFLSAQDVIKEEGKITTEDLQNFIDNASDIDTFDFVSQWGLSLDDFQKYISKLNADDITTLLDGTGQAFMQAASNIDATSRSLSDFSSLYAQAINGMTSSEILNVIQNWEKYDDLLIVENGQLKINKALVAANAQAKIDELIITTEGKKADSDATVLSLSLQKKLLEVRISASEGNIKATQAEIDALAKKYATEKATLRLSQGYMVSLQDINKYEKELTDSYKNAYSSSQLASAKTELANVTAALNAATSNSKKYADQIEYLKKLNIADLFKEVDTSTSKASSSTSKLNKQLENLKTLLSSLKDELSDTTDVYERVRDKMKDMVQDEIDALDKANDALDENISLYESRITVAKTALQTQIDALQAELDALDESNDAEDKANELAEKKLELEQDLFAMQKAKDAYEAAKKNKNTRVYDATQGWIYTSNQDDVNSAYDDYVSATSTYNDLLKDISDLEKEIALRAQKDALQAQIDILDKQSDALGDISGNVKDATDKYLNDTTTQEWLTEFLGSSEEDRTAMLSVLQAIWTSDVNAQNANKEQTTALKDLLEHVENVLEVDDDISSLSSGVKEWLESFQNSSIADREAMVTEMHDSYTEYYTVQNAKIDKIQDSIDSIEGNTSLTATLLKYWGTGKENTPLNSFADGGVAQLSGLVNKTGMLNKNTKVHGTNYKPELILNSGQQANLLYQLARQKPTTSTQNNNNNNSMYVSSLYITANDGDTLKDLLLEAKQLAIVKK